MTSTASLSLSALYSKALSNVSKAWELSTIDDEAQNCFLSALADLRQVASRVAALSLFSPNDILEDISTPDLLYMTVSFVLAEVQFRLRVADRDERKTNLISAQAHFEAFVSNVESYGVLSEIDRTLHKQQPRDPAERREMKIKQYKATQDLRIRIEATQQRRKRQCLAESRPPNNFDLILSLLLPASVDSAANDEGDSEMDDFVREASLLLLRLFYAHACSQLEGIDKELDLLRNFSPPSPPPPPSEEHQRRAKEEALWRLDSASQGNEKPLLDLNGKPLRPFMILPAGVSDRARLQAQVFGPGHRLPTMTIDEYLEIERKRGKIITGGGHQSREKPTSSGQLTLDSEMDGTVSGELKSEEKRQKDEQWAQFKDANPKGVGNTLNRG